MRFAAPLDRFPRSGWWQTEPSHFSALNRHTWRNNVGFATLFNKETRESNAQKASASAWCRSPCAMRHRNIFSINRCTSKLTGVASGPISFRGSQISR
jgi:hypothetical protein